MFRLGATYNAVDVHEIVVNEPNDNRIPEKRLLRGIAVPTSEKMTSEGKNLTILRVIIYPFGAYYYPWVSNRWKAVTRHIYNITALRVLDKARLKVIDSFLPIGKSSEGFTLHSSRSNLKKRRVVAKALGIGNDPQKRRRGTNTSLNDEGMPNIIGNANIIGLGGSSSIPNIPKNHLSSSLQKYANWLANTFDEGTVNVLQGKPTESTDSCDDSSLTNRGQDASATSSGVFRVGSIITSLYGVGIVIQIKQVSFSETTETAFLQELSPEQHGFLVVKAVHWTLANGYSPILYLNLSTCKLIADNCSSSAIAYTDASAGVNGVSGNELMMMGFTGQGRRLSHHTASAAKYAVAPMMMPSLQQQQQVMSKLEVSSSSSSSTTSSSLDTTSDQGTRGFPNHTMKCKQNCEVHRSSSKEGIHNDYNCASSSKKYGSFDLLTGAVEALATASAPTTVHELRSEDDVDASKEAMGYPRCDKESEKTELDDQKKKKTHEHTSFGQFLENEVVEWHYEDLKTSKKDSVNDREEAEQQGETLDGSVHKNTGDGNKRCINEDNESDIEEDFDDKRFNKDHDKDEEEDGSQPSETATPTEEALPAKRQRKINTKYLEYDYPTLSNSSRKKTSKVIAPLLEVGCESKGTNNDALHEGLQEMPLLPSSSSSASPTYLKHTKGVFTGKTFGHLTRIGGTYRGHPLPAAPEKVKEATTKRKPANARSMAELESFLFSHQSELYGIPCEGESCEVLCNHTEVWCPMIIASVRTLSTDQFVANLRWRGWNEGCIEKSFLFTDDKYFDTHNENRIVSVFKEGNRVKKYKCWVKLKMKKEDPDFPKWPGIVYVRSPETATGVQHLLDQKTMYIELYGAGHFSGDMRQFQNGLWRHTPDFKPYFYYYVDNIKKSGMTSKYGTEFAAAFVEMTEDKETSDFSFEFDGTLEIGKITSCRKNGTRTLLLSENGMLADASGAPRRKPLPPPAIPPPEHQPIPGINYIPPDHLKQQYIRIPEQQQKIFADIARQQLSQFNAFFPHFTQFPGGLMPMQNPFVMQHQINMQNSMATQHMTPMLTPMALQDQISIQNLSALEQNVPLSHPYPNHQMLAPDGATYALNNQGPMVPAEDEKTIMQTGSH